MVVAGWRGGTTDGKNPRARRHCPVFVNPALHIINLWIRWATTVERDGDRVIDDKTVENEDDTNWHYELSDANDTDWDGTKSWEVEHFRRERERERDGSMRQRIAGLGWATRGFFSLYQHCHSKRPLSTTLKMCGTDGRHDMDPLLRDPTAVTNTVHAKLSFYCRHSLLRQQTIYSYLFARWQLVGHGGFYQQRGVADSKCQRVLLTLTFHFVCPNTGISFTRASENISTKVEIAMIFPAICLWIQTGQTDRQTDSTVA